MLQEDEVVVLRGLALDNQLETNQVVLRSTLDLHREDIDLARLVRVRILVLGAMRNHPAKLTKVVGNLSLHHEGIDWSALEKLLANVS
jgi:hypothetical protein